MTVGLAQRDRLGPPALDAFLCYSHVDAGPAHAVCDALDGLGVRTWVDWRDLRHDDDWWLAARSAIDASPSLILLATRAAARSRPCQAELDYAWEAAKPVHTVVVSTGLTRPWSLDSASLARVLHNLRTARGAAPASPRP